MGDHGIVIATADAGETWTVWRCDRPDTLRRFEFVDEVHGWAIGETESGGGVLIVTSDGGATWTTCSEAGNYLCDVDVADSQHRRALGYGGTVLSTSDRGASWSRQGTGTNGYLTAVCFSDSKDGWAVGYSGPIIAIADGGRTWTRQRLVAGDLTKD